MRVLNYISWLAVAVLIPGAAFAAEGAASMNALDGIGAGMAIGLAAIGGALGQSKACSAALEGIGRNPGAAGQMFTPMLLGLVLIESLVIYALVISLKLVGIF